MNNWDWSDFSQMEDNFQNKFLDLISIVFRIEFAQKTIKYI